jgi:uncharacterized membrane-anchored protein YitT (DUF2179 family)
MSTAAGAIVQTNQLLKVVLYSLVAGVGVSAIFALGVSSAAGLIDALRARRTGAAVGWGALAATCAVATAAVVVIGIVVMSTK